LHPDFIEIIKYASDAGIKEIAFLTNGSNMSLDFFKRVTEAGATWITWSVDGLEEQYEAIRKPLIFEETLQKLRDISEYKKQVKLIKPLLKVQCVWPAIKDDPEKFYNTIAPLCDLVAYNPLIDYLHKDCDIVYEEGFSCPQHYQRVVIASDGRACMCSGDGFVECPVGDARIQSVYDIWHGDVFERMREIHASDKGFLKLECCRKCFYPRKTEPDESAWVNGRKIIIENYINRSQVIGE
jgi:hypothetical protein